MSQRQSSKKIENEFLELKESMNVNEWNDPEHLTNISREFEEANPELYLRVLQRIKSLNKVKLKKLNHKIKQKSQSIDANNQSNIDAKEDNALEVADKKEHAESSNKKIEEDNQASRAESIGTVSDKQTSSVLQKTLNIIKRPIILMVAIPWVLFAFYQIVIATPRYESQAKVIVKQPDAMATMDTGMAVLSGLGMTPSNSDTQLVVAYIRSVDMLEYIDKEIQLKKHYESDASDIYTRLAKDSSKESFLKFYNDHINVEVDEKAQVITILVQGFTPEYTQKLNNLIVQRAEWFINEVNRNLASEQLKFIKEEHESIEDRLASAKKELLEYQSEYSLLDPEVESAAIQKIAYSIEAKVAEKKAELNILNEVLSNESAQIVALKNQIRALEEQLIDERDRLSSSNGELSISQILSRFSDYKINVELALQAYTSSLISLEKARVESYRQIKFLVTVEKPTIPQDSSYPKVLYNLSLLAVVLLMLYGISAIIRATIKELN